jgi:hypothetical protein
MSEEIERAFNAVFERHYTVEEAAEITRLSVPCGGRRSSRKKWISAASAAES